MRENASKIEPCWNSLFQKNIRMMAVEKIMYLDEMHTFQTGVRLEVSTAAIQSLIEHATERERFLELVRIKRPEDLHPYLFVTVRHGAEALMTRRRRWARSIRKDVLAGKAVSYDRFSRLFWRDIDEEDPDGDEWHRHFGSEAFAREIDALLDKVRAAQRALRRSDDVVVRMNWDFLGGAIFPKDRPAF